jgi:hypothetical protein
MSMEQAPKVEGTSSGTSALSAGFGVFSIWRRGHFEDCWSQTSHSVKARTDKEAQAKVKRKFSGCGFSAMSLVAVRYGKTPNALAQADAACGVSPGAEGSTT